MNNEESQAAYAERSYRSRSILAAGVAVLGLVKTAFDAKHPATAEVLALDIAWDTSAAGVGAYLWEKRSRIINASATEDSEKSP